MTTAAAPLQSPLHNLHLQAGAKMIDFHGWLLPVQYSGILDEHNSVRKAAGLFDISHMGQVIIEGPKAFDFIQNLITNDLQRTFDKGLGVYGHMLKPDGTVIDDIFVYGLKESKRFFFVVNSATHAKDLAWLREHATDGVTIMDLEHRAGIAIQGPKALDIIRKTVAGISELPRFAFQQIKAGDPNQTFWGCRTGYTGEEGAEFFGPISTISTLWNQLLENGKSLGLKPCGLGARDTLRLEVGYPLYGNELTEDHTSLESNMEWAIKWTKGDFIGRKALEAQKAAGVKTKLMGFELTERGIPRGGYAMKINGQTVGQVASGTFAPTLQKGIGTAFFPVEYAQVGQAITIELPGKSAQAQVTGLQFLKK